MSYTGQMLDQGGAVFNVMAYYQSGYTHTQALQAAINAATASGGRGTVLIPPGNYEISQVELKAGITISGYGAVLSRPAPVNGVNQGVRMLQLQDRTPGYAPAYTGAADSELLTIEGLTLDGRNSLQTGYSTGAGTGQHLLFLAADPQTAGRVRVELRDLVLRNSMQDGISLHTNVDAQIVNCRVSDCLRAGLAITGGNTRCQVQNLVTEGRTNPTGIHIAPSIGGYNRATSTGDSNLAVDVVADGMELDSKFDVQVSAGSTFLATNVRAGAFFRLIAPNATVRIENSLFEIGEQFPTGEHFNRIVQPMNVTFRDCTFTLRETQSTEANRTLNTVHVYWNVSGSNLLGQRLRFIDCIWNMGATVEAGDTTHAIYCEYDNPGLDNRLIVSGGHVQPGFDTAFWMSQGGKWIIEDVEIEAARGFYWNGLVNGSIQTAANIRIERVGLRGVTEYMHVANIDANNIIDHRDVVVEQEQNVLAAPSGVVYNKFLGGRTIRVTAPPSGTNPVAGLVGDVARLRTPVAGSPYEWICTVGSTAGATWKVKSTLAA